MHNLYSLVARKNSGTTKLPSNEVASVVYHDIFDYPLNLSDIVKWQAGSNYSGGKNVVNKNGHLFIEGREGLIYKSLLRKRISEKKLEIAKKGSKIISMIPSVKMVAVTGSLAMNNSGENSDIDLMVITKKANLWTTRILSYLLLYIYGIKTRRAGVREENNRLCLNIWLDESDLVWDRGDRNIYTAHEIAQIKPLFNRQKTYERLLHKNKWVLMFWPNAVKIGKHRQEKFENKAPPGLLEKICFWFQYQYMKKKISREVISPTRALFHPQDWGKVVLSRINTEISS